MNKSARDQLRSVLNAANIGFEECEDNHKAGRSVAVFHIRENERRCDGITLRLTDDMLILWVVDGWVDDQPGIGDAYHDFCSRWTKDTPGYSAHLLNPFKEDGAAPACKVTYPIPTTRHEMKRLLLEQILGTDLAKAISCCHEIKDRGSRT